MKKVHIAVGISISILFAGEIRADELESLDDPAPAAATAPDGLESLEETPAAGGESLDVAVDLGSDEAFTPYNFARNNAWSFLPIGALILVGLHLIRVPKRKSKRKIDQARRFFRGISGEATNSAILVPKSEKK